MMLPGEIYMADFGAAGDRFPDNVPGSFYTLGYKFSCGTWGGNCLACEAPEAEAPDLLAPLTNGNHNTYFIKQPETEAEIERACRAIEVCCVYALRYAGTDPAIIHRLRNSPAHCDFILFYARPKMRSFLDGCFLF